MPRSSVLPFLYLRTSTYYLIEQFALLEAYYLVARLVQKFDRMESCDEREWMELSALATTCKNGVLVRLHPSGIYEKC